MPADSSPEELPTFQNEDNGEKRAQSGGDGDLFIAGKSG